MQLTLFSFPLTMLSDSRELETVRRALSATSSKCDCENCRWRMCSLAPLSMSGVRVVTDRSKSYTESD